MSRRRGFTRVASAELKKRFVGGSELPLISVLILSYARVDHLRRTFLSLRNGIDYDRLEFVLSDDGSPREMQEVMRTLPFDKHLLGSSNLGLGANSNRGLRACSGDLIMQIQDDWVYKGPSDLIYRALDAFTGIDDLHLIRLARVPEDVRSTRETLRTGVSVRLFKSPRSVAGQFRRGEDRWLYSDTPHIKTKLMVSAVGPYLEGVPMQWSELDMRERFLEHEDLKAGSLEDMEAFEHIGAAHSHRNQSRVQAVGHRLMTHRLTGRMIRRLLFLYSRTRSRLRGSRSRAARAL